MPCSQNTDQLKLIREGTSQDDRLISALDPAFAMANDRTPAHEMVFAQTYARYVRYYTFNNTALGDWQRFFSDDVSVQLALAATQNVKMYSSRVKESLDYVNNLDNKNNDDDLKMHLGYLFSSVGTLAKNLDLLKIKIPREFALAGLLENSIKSHLATGLQRLIGYFKAGSELHLLNESMHIPKLQILGLQAVSFKTVLDGGLSKDWVINNAVDWATYVQSIAPDATGYGSGSNLFEKINHLVTHNLFTSVFDQFLKIYARIVTEAKQVLEATFTNWDNHAPHYALFLAFLRLQEYACQETNTITRRHLDFYYRDILQLREKPAEPSQVQLLVELAKYVDSHLLEKGMRFIAGKDVFFTSDGDFVANQAKLVSFKKFYRHRNLTSETLEYQDGRLFASPIANSDDGVNPELTSTDHSWHPFFNKVYVNGVLEKIVMPKAEIGFAIASHYLLMAEGKRIITLNITLARESAALITITKTALICSFTSAEGWINKMPDTDVALTSASQQLQIVITLVGDDAAVTSYHPKIHGYTFNTVLPVVLIKLKHDNNPFIYSSLQDVQIQSIELNVQVINLRTLAISNDFGPVDMSKAFQPFGAVPDVGSSFVVGSKELFQKNYSLVKLNFKWKIPAVAYPVTGLPSVTTSFLKEGEWKNDENASPFPIKGNELTLTADHFNETKKHSPDFSGNVFYSTSSRNGFVRLSLTGNLGQAAYITALQAYLIAQAMPTPSGTLPTPVPQVPVAESITIDYTANQTISLNLADETAFEQRPAKFFHLAPFGHAEQHPKLNTGHKVFLLPQFTYQSNETPEPSEAEFYIGLTGLKPPQNVSLLFQVTEGTSNPLVLKPKPNHLQWSYLQQNEWRLFANANVSDQTAGLLKSGIVTLAVPRSANTDNTLLTPGMHWIRIAVKEKTDAVCRLIVVAAQAFSATLVNTQNNLLHTEINLPTGTISKPEQPVAAIKKIEQPFSSFGGRAKEEANAFYTRISERLRHKDRAIALWDYEKLVLEAFPQVYKVKCLNHTQYEPGSLNNEGIYKELAPGHVTLVTIPRQHDVVMQNPLRPFTSVGLLDEISAYLQKRLSCFVTLHVINPEFEEVRVSCKVRFRSGFDESFYTVKLKESITRFLSPWAFTGNASPSFGGKIYQSTLLNYVEEQPYVDYVTDFQLIHLLGSLVTKAEVEGSKAVSVLVSVPASGHSITVIHPAEVNTPRENCICQT